MEMHLARFAILIRMDHCLGDEGQGIVGTAHAPQRHAESISMKQRGNGLTSIRRVNRRTHTDVHAAECTTKARTFLAKDGYSARPWRRSAPPAQSQR